MTKLPDESRQPDLRASDQDREAVADVLRGAASEGRLELVELDDRLRQVYAARTYGDLAGLTRDLPAPTAATEDAPRPAERSKPPRWGFGIMSGFDRRGRWIAGTSFRCLALCGGGKLDLREAILERNQITVRAFALMGGVKVIVPDDADVTVTGVGLMGGFDQRASGQGQPGGPRIHVSGVAFWGGVVVKRRGRPERSPEPDAGP
ncbi:DUF1707 and DUF2154 domain-containing protein [Natronosporangium hydrolyticum]|uniref:DUF1707 and DUF2154 domain-containing protein n=1 Tax=Natronosporangium hydrolyticum TaxID=2811111 RepID=A0A895YKL1_9ACTN|nr:DUF1707 domain-containing protein [Natronosporangium hydrolyticum]QSB16039.1 DUF1707 and DUF2154 domain-containing protein [Natronosporangium hydrolyticum]